MSATQYMDPLKRAEMNQKSNIRIDNLKALRAFESPSASSSSSSSAESENSSEFERRMTQGSPAGEMTEEDYEQLRKMDITPIHTPTATFNPPLTSSSLTPYSDSNFPDVPYNAHPVHRDMEMPEVPTHEVDYTPRGQFPIIHEEDRDALVNFGVETPDHEKNPDAYNRNLEDFLGFYTNPTLSRNRRPFGQGRRTKKCRRCRNCKTCKRSRKHYRKDKGKKHKRHILGRPRTKGRKYKK
jgi:hypothetical protein